ncbi:MAG: radical SAM protein [Planctomycetia bacterium]|nr:radical SAM protein [Planctomycetia bacterium]
MGKIIVLVRLFFRALTELSPRILYKAIRLWVWKGFFALAAYKKRLKEGNLFPPFLFFALTNACSLACRGCWNHRDQPESLEPEDVERTIRTCAEQSAWFHTFLGGEPLMYPKIWEIIQNHPECYFQIITNAQILDADAIDKIREAGNITPLVSIDGFAESNDARRGEGTFRKAADACRELQKNRLLYGVATVVNALNFEEVLSDDYVDFFIKTGAMYLWYYMYRPVGMDPAPELALDPDQIVAFRQRLLELRKKKPILLIDTYWDVSGKAVCPAVKGLGFHIGPKGGIEPCPPLSVCKETLSSGPDLFKTINKSRFLREFQKFAHSKTEGCVILEAPGDLARFFKDQKAADQAEGRFLKELELSPSRTSHHLPGREIPEDFWFYQILKKNLFFGMGAYG